MQNFIKNHLCKNEALYKTIVEATKNSPDITTAKKKTVEIIGKALNADRCFITEYDAEKERFIDVSEEYLSSADLKSYLNIDLNIHVPNFASELKKGKTLIYNQQKTQINGKPFDINDSAFEMEKKSIEEFKVYSAVIVPIFYINDFLGDIVVHYVDKKHNAGKDELDLLEMVSSQFAIILNQEKVCKLTQQKINRENILGKIITKMHSSLDSNMVKESIVTQVSKVFGADICFIVDYEEDKNYFSIAKQAEYQISDKEKSFIGYNSDSVNIKRIIEKFKRGEEINFANAKEYIKAHELENTPEEKFLEEHNIKSSYNFPILYSDELLGYLILEYTKDYKDLQKDDLFFLKIIANQTGIALYQARLYEKIQKQAQREKLLKDITTQSLKTFDLTQVKTIVDTVGIMTKADRCFFVQMEPGAKKVKPIDYEGEYLSSPEIKSIVGHDFPAEEGKKFTQIYLEKKDVVYFDYEKILESENEEFQEMIKYVKKFDLKCSIGIPIFFEGNFIAILAIEFVKEKMVPSQDDLDFFRTLGQQIGMLSNQIQLYNSTKKKAERESLLRNITETIRSSLDIEKTLAYICEETAKIFNVQRTAITMFPNPNDFEEFIFRKEYITSEEIKGFVEVPLYSKVASVWGETLIKSKEVLALDNLLESDIPDYFKNAYNTIGVKSMIGTSIRKGEDVWGTLVLAEYNEIRYWSDEEKTLLKTIADQVYIAINQAELYQKEKLSAERERISRNIVEILRSTMDKNIIKRLFVKNIGKFFNADRVLISEYDYEEKKYLPIDENSEYLSSPNEKTLVGFDWSKPEISEFVQPLIEKRELNIYNIDDYLEKNPKSNELISFFEYYNIKSSYNFPILYQHQIIGFFCLDFMKEAKALCDEDINKLRSICTQAGIALYHADLYTKAQQWLNSKDIVLSDISEKIKEPTDEILEASIILSQNEFERKVQIDYLNNIILSCNELLELTKTINGY